MSDHPCIFNTKSYSSLQVSVLEVLYSGLLSAQKVPPWIAIQTLQVNVSSTYLQNTFRNRCTYKVSRQCVISCEPQYNCFERSVSYKLSKNRVFHPCEYANVSPNCTFAWMTFRICYRRRVFRPCGFEGAVLMSAAPGSIWGNADSLVFSVWCGGSYASKVNWPIWRLYLR